MVRTIDGDERRRVLASSVWQLMRRGGLDAASVRAVAAEAGLSAGSVRHFFASQDELHVFAMEELIARTADRVQRALASARDDPAAGELTNARARVRAGLTQLLPIDDESAADFLVHLQFLAKAMFHPPLAAVATTSQHALHDFYVECLTYLADRGGEVGRLDESVRRLSVLIDGLVLRRLTAPDLLSETEMLDILNRHVESAVRGDAE